MSEAKYNTGFGATVNASMGFNQSGPQMNSVYQDLREAQTVSVAVSMPILQWGGAQRVDPGGARRRESRSQRCGAVAQQIIQEAHFAALQLPQSVRQLELAAKGDTVGQKRFEVANNRYQVEPHRDRQTCTRRRTRRIRRSSRMCRRCAGTGRRTIGCGG